MQAKVGSKRYICSLTVKNPEAPKINPFNFSMDLAKGITTRSYKITPCQNVYVPEILDLHNVWRMAETGLPTEERSEYKFPINITTISASLKQYADAIYRKMNSDTVTYTAYDRITVASDDDGNTDHYHSLSLIKGKVLFTYNYDYNENEYIHKTTKYIG